MRSTPSRHSEATERLPLRSAIVWWVAISGIGWLVALAAIRLFTHLLG